MRNDPPLARAHVSTRMPGVRRASPSDALPVAPAHHSLHALRRAAQRNLTDRAIEYVLTWGRSIQRTGVEFYFLARKDIPLQHRHLPWVMRLAGVVVLASLDGEVITLYHRPDALRAIQRKMKYRINGTN